MVEGIADRSVVGVICLAARGDGASAQAIQPGRVELCQRLRIAGVCIDIERAALCARANTTNCPFDQLELQQWLALASLPKAEDTILGRLQMRHRSVNDLLLSWREREAILWRDKTLFVLLGNTADTARITPRRDSTCGLPAAEEQIASCWATVVERAVSVM